MKNKFLSDTDMQNKFLMENLIKNTLYRVINKTKLFSAIRVEDHIENHVAVKGPNQFLGIFTFIRKGEVVIEIQNDYHSHVVHYDMAMSLQDIVTLVLEDIDMMDRNTPLDEEDLENLYK